MKTITGLPEIMKLIQLLEQLNSVYGENTYLLTKKMTFACPECKYHEDFTPNKKIISGEYGIKPKVSIEEVIPGLHSEILTIVYYELIFTVKCQCRDPVKSQNKENKVHSSVTLGHALKVLQEAEAGKKPPHEFYTC